MESVTASFELRMAQIRDMKKPTPTEMIVYGRLPCMVTEQCIIKNSAGRCACHTPGQMADRMGITDLLNAAGAEIIPDTCPDQPCWHYLKGKVGITESPKCAYYPRRRGINFMIRDLDTCIEAALTGEVK